MQHVDAAAVAGDGAVDGGEDALGHGAHQLHPQGVADGVDPVAHQAHIAVTQLGGGKVLGVHHFQHGDVLLRVGAHQTGLVHAAHIGGHEAGLPLGDDVGIGDHIAVGGQDDAGTHKGLLAGGGHHHHGGGAHLAVNLLGGEGFTGFRGQRHHVRRASGVIGGDGAVVAAEHGGDGAGAAVLRGGQVGVGSGGGGIGPDKAHHAGGDAGEQHQHGAGGDDPHRLDAPLFGGLAGGDASGQGRFLHIVADHLLRRRGGAGIPLHYLPWRRGGGEAGGGLNGVLLSVFFLHGRIPLL